MKYLNCVCYSLTLALIIVALFLIVKKIKSLNEKLDNVEVNDQTRDNIYNSLISEDEGKYPIKILNEGEVLKGKAGDSKVQERIMIEPQFYNVANQMVDAAYDVIQDGNKNPFIIEPPGDNEVESRNIKDDKLLKNKIENEVNALLSSKQEGYFIDLGEIDGSLRHAKQSYICGSPQWPVGFDLKINKEIADKVKSCEYVRTSPYTGGDDQHYNYSFTCVDKDINNFLYCRGNNACNYKDVKK